MLLSMQVVSLLKEKCVTTKNFTAGCFFLILGSYVVDPGDTYISGQNVSH